MPGIYKLGTSAKDRMSNVRPYQTVEWGDSIFKVSQVIDSNNAVLSVLGGKYSNGHMIAFGKPIRVWYEGPTEKLVDGKSFKKLVPVRLMGSKTRATVGSTSAMYHVKDCESINMEELTKTWLKKHPSALKLKTKKYDVIYADVVGYKSGKVHYQFLGDSLTVTWGKLDDESKKLIAGWRKANKPKK